MSGVSYDHPGSSICPPSLSGGAGTSLVLASYPAKTTDIIGHSRSRSVQKPVAQFRV